MKAVPVGSGLYMLTHMKLEATPHAIVPKHPRRADAQMGADGMGSPGVANGGSDRKRR